MSINLKAPELRELKPRIMVCGVGGAGGNAVNNMIVSGLLGVEFIVANTDAQALTKSKADRIIQMGLQVTEGLGAGSHPEVGRAAAEEAEEEIRDHLAGAHMCFVTAGMGGGTGTGAAPVVARIAREMGILTVGVVTKPFTFEGARRMRMAEAGILELQKAVDTLITIPNQNLFRVANEKTTFADAFAMADQVLYSGVACITDLMVKEGLINLDFADVRAIMREMGKAMMGTGEASGDKRAILAAEAAIANPLLDEVSMKGARGLLISITGGNDLTLYEVDEAASRIRQEVDEDANIILGATFDASLDGIVRVSVVATGIDKIMTPDMTRDMSVAETRIAEAAQSLREMTRRVPASAPAPRQPLTYQQAVNETPTQTYMDYSGNQGATSAAAPSQAPATSSLQASAYAAQQAAAFEAHQSTHQQDVHIQAVAPRPAFQAAPAPVVAPVAEYEDPRHFMPPQAEQLPLRPQRMPSVEDLPRPGRDMIRARADEQVAETHPANQRRTLLERLASFGRAGEDEHAHQPPQASQNQPSQSMAPSVSSTGYAPRGPAPGPVHAQYAKPQAAPRGAQGQLDPHGRAAPQRPSDDDQLEIPAFLRRQSS